VKRRTLGHTGLAVSEIGFGCGPTGGLMIRGSQGERRDAVARALDLGINYFDTAPDYGSSASESHLGETLRQLGAAPVVATKVALRMEELGDIGGAIRRSVEDSLRRLRLAELPVVQLHNRVATDRAPRAPFGTGALLAVEDVLGPHGVLEAFEQLRRRGLARFFGCSAFGGDMDVVRRLIDGGAIDVLTVHYSILNRTAWSGQAGAGVLDYSHTGKRAASQGLGTVALRVLEGGALASIAGVRLSHPELATSLDAAGIDPAEAAIRFALSNRDVSVVLVGFSALEQIEDAARYSRLGPLPRELLDSLEGA
jgi:aryl-alcohol dehydrogenase-like predicted oxidoreductase